MKLGDTVYVDPCFFTERYPRRLTFGIYRIPCIVIRDLGSKCTGRDCRSTCTGDARWLRTTDRHKVWLELREKKFRGASWNYDASKICTAYIHPESGRP